MEPHLRPVDPSPLAEPPREDKRRSDPRKRASKSLPTDRMKFEVQERVLQALGRMSGHGKRPVNTEQLARAMNNEVSRYTVGLSHNFFVDCGWVEKHGRGEYAAADSLVAYTTRLAADPGNIGRAVESLRASALSTWFWRAMEPQIIGGAPMAEVMVTLMREAEVGEAHRPQLRNLLEWLRYVGLVTISNDRIAAVESRVPETDPDESKPPAEPEERSRQQRPADTPGEKSTTQEPGRPGVMLSFDFEFQLTADDLGKLSPEQIRAVFEAVGTVMAIRNTA